MLTGFLFFWVRFFFFLGPFPVFKKILKSQFVDLFPLFLGQFPVFKKVFNSQFVERFPLFFWVHFLSFWVCFRFTEKVVISHIDDRFPLFRVGFLFFGSVSSNLGPFPVFRKKFWSLSMLIWLHPTHTHPEGGGNSSSILKD